MYKRQYIYNTYISGVYDNHPVWISNPDIPDALPDGREWFFCQYTFYGRSENEMCIRDSSKAEKVYIEGLLERYPKDMNKVAEILSISRRQLFNKLVEFGLK